MLCLFLALQFLLPPFFDLVSFVYPSLCIGHFRGLKDHYFLSGLLYSPLFLPLENPAIILPPPTFRVRASLLCNFPYDRVIRNA